MLGDPRHGCRTDNGTHVRACVEEARRIGALSTRKPLTGGFDRRREISRFPEAQRDSGEEEAAHTSNGTVCHGRDTPEKRRQSITAFGAEAVHEPAKEKIAGSVNAKE